MVCKEGVNVRGEGESGEGEGESRVYEGRERDGCDSGEKERRA